MSTMYGEGARALQDRFDTRRLADRIEERLVRAAIDDGDRAFVEARDMFFLASVDARGHVQCSYKGGAPGFVRVLDPTTIAFPSYDGNGQYLSLGAITEIGEIGMLFVDFDGQSRVRVNGTATIDPDDPLLPSWPEAQVVVRVRVREVFPNCGRYIHRYALVERSRFVPHAGEPTPVPSWKQSEWAADALPALDPARDPGREARRK